MGPINTAIHLLRLAQESAREANRHAAEVLVRAKAALNAAEANIRRADLLTGAQKDPGGT